MPERPLVPGGLVYQPDFLTEAEEQQILAVLEAMELHTITMHGQTARRTVRHFGLHDGEVTLQPRSGYLLSGAARYAWQHSIPPTKALRYSITFRTLKAS
jgi:hypothetical protein